MKTFSQNITLVKNSRGCYILDTVKGCSVCASEKPRGCYGDCYAKRIADRYKIDFSNPVSRDFYKDARQLMFYGFEDESHLSKIRKEIRAASMPFIRIGEMGDPSEDWRHTTFIIDKIRDCGKKIVIITKHWKFIDGWLLPDISGTIINTSISALDDESEINRRLREYERLKPFCHSILRVVSCSFNLNTQEGAYRNSIQEQLLKEPNVIETVFRPSKDNPLVTARTINVKPIHFLGATMLASMRDENTYLGRCETCPDMCGIPLATSPEIR